MQNISANALMILCICSLRLALAAPPPAGSLDVSSARYTLPGGYRCGRDGVTYIWYPTELDNGPFPIVSFGHGIGGGIAKDLLKSIASLGFVVLAPAKGVCDDHGVDILYAMEWSRIQGNASLHEALGYVDWERRAILGHSFGGAHAMMIAPTAGKEHHLLAVVASHGTTEQPNLTLPLFIASEVTPRGIASATVHRRAFEAAVQAIPRVLATAKDAKHMEPMKGGRMNPYMAHFLGCHVAGLQGSCDRVYEDGPDSICRAQPMSVCEIVGKAEAPTPLPTTPVLTTQAPTLLTTTLRPTPTPTTIPTDTAPTSVSPTTPPSTPEPTPGKELTLENDPELRIFLELMSLRTSHPTSRPTSLPTSHPTSLPTMHPTSLPTSQPTSLPTLEPTLACTDRSAECSLWAPLYCNSEEYGEFVRVICRSSCDACITDDCADEYTACEVWKEHGHCESQRFAPFLDTYCKKSCDACDVHRRMSFRDDGNENDTVEVPEFEMPDAPLAMNGDMIRGSVSPVIIV